MKVYGELKFASLHRVSTEDRPVAADIGRTIFNTTTNQMEVWNGTSWQGPGGQVRLAKYTTLTRPAAADNEGLVIINTTSQTVEYALDGSWLIIGSTGGGSDSLTNLINDNTSSITSIQAMLVAANAKIASAERELLSNTSRVLSLESEVVGLVTLTSDTGSPFAKSTELNSLRAQIRTLTAQVGDIDSSATGEIKKLADLTTVVDANTKYRGTSGRDISSALRNSKTAVQKILEAKYLKQDIEGWNGAHQDYDRGAPFFSTDFSELAQDWDKIPEKTPIHYKLHWIWKRDDNQINESARRYLRVARGGSFAVLAETTDNNTYPIGEWVHHIDDARYGALTASYNRWEDTPDGMTSVMTETTFLKKEFSRPIDRIKGITNVYFSLEGYRLDSKLLLRSSVSYFVNPNA